MRLFPTKRRLYRIGIGLAILVSLALIANGFMIWRTDARLQARIDAIRAAGDPATIADLAPEPIPDEQNTAAYIDKMVPRLDEFDRELAHFYNKTPIGQAYGAARERNEAPTTEQLAAIRAIVDKYPDVEAGIAAAAACDKYASLTDFSVNHRELIDDTIDRAQKIRMAARFAAWRMEVLISEGKADAAARLGIQVLRLARLHNAEPLLINSLVGIAVRMTVAQQIYDALATGEVSPDTLAALDKELALQDDSEQLAHVFQTEQAFAISVASEGGVVPQVDDINPFWFQLVGWPVKSMYINALDAFDDQFELAQKPYYEIRDRFDAKGALKPTNYGVLGDLLAPSLGAAYASFTRNQAMMRSLRIANAFASYRRQHDREANGLDELVLPKEVTMDPFSGEPLRVKRNDECWIIYTVMQNGVDDGGDFTEQKDHGFAPRKHRAME